MAKNKKNEKDKIQLPKVSVKSTNDLAMKTLKSGGVTQKDKEEVRKVYGNKQSVPKDATMQGRGPVATPKQPTFNSEKELDSYVKSSVREDAKITPGAGVDYLKRMGAQSRIGEYDTASYDELTEMSKGATGQERYKIDAARVRNANPQQRMELRKELQTQYDYYAPIYSDSKTMMDRYQSRKAAVTPEAYKATQARMYESKEGMDWYSALLGAVDDGIRATADDNTDVLFGRKGIENGANKEYRPTKSRNSQYDYINMYQRGELSESDIQSGLIYPEYTVLTQYETDILNSLPEEDRESYLSAKSDVLKKRYSEKQQEEAIKYAQEHPIAAGLDSAVQGAFWGIPAAVDNIVEGITGDVDTYDMSSRSVRQADTYRSVGSQKIREKYGKAAGIAYDTGLTLLDVGINVLAGKAVGAGLGKLGVNASKAASTFASTNMAGRAASSTMMSIADRGGNDFQIVTGGLASGLAEALFEKYSLDKLLSTRSAVGVGNIIKSIAAQSAIEGSEELFTEAANMVTDAIIMQGKSESELRRRELMLNYGLPANEAVKQVVQENIMQIAKAGGMGALAGGIMGGGAITAANVSHAGYMKRSGERLLENPEAMNNVLRIGMENNSNAAAEAFQMLNNGYRIDGKQAGNMIESVIADSMEKNGGFLNIMRSIQAIEGRGAEYIGSEEAIETTKAVMEFVSGTATKAQSDIISRSEGAVTLLTAIEGHNAAWESVKKAAGRDLRRDASTTLEMTSKGVRNTPSSVSEADNVYSEGVKVRIPEGSRIVKNIVLDDESMKVRRRDEQAYKNVEMLAQDLGMRVKYVNNLTDSTGTALDGVITSQGIFINSEAKNPSRFAATHEFSHRMKQASSEHWQKYQDFVIKKLQSSGRYENIFKNKAAAYNNSNADYINEEIAADYIGELFDNEAELSEFIRESRRDAVTIRDVWYKILDKLGLSSEKEKAQRMWRDAYKAAMKSVEEGSAGEYEASPKFMIAYTTKNEPVVVIEDDILDGVSKKNWVETTKKAITKFKPGIKVSGRFIKVNAQTTGEYLHSDYTDSLKKNDKIIYKDKLNAAGHLDEIILSSRNFINEDLKHERTDNIKEFARGNVLLQIGGNKYTASVIVGLTKGNKMVLYDIVDIDNTDFDIKKAGDSERTLNKSSQLRQESPTTYRVTQKDSSVNTNSMQKVENYARKSVSGARISDIEAENAELRKQLDKADAQVTKQKTLRSKDEIKRKIDSDYRYLYQMVNNPTDARHVPEDMRAGVSFLLSCFNFETKQLDRIREEGRETESPTAVRLSKMYDAYGDIIRKAWGIDTGSKENNLLDEYLSGDLQELRDMIPVDESGEFKRIQDMSIEELRSISKVLTAVHHSITQRNKAFNSAIKEDISELGVNSVLDMQSIRNARKGSGERLDYEGIVKTLDKYLNISNVQPWDFFHQMGGTMERLYMEERYAFNRHIENIREASEVLQKATEGLNLKKLTGKHAEKVWFKLSSGEEIRLSKGQILSIYALYQRNQGKEHILGGGIVTNAEAKDERGHKSSANNAHRVNEADLGVMFETLSEDEKRMVGEVVRFLSKRCSAWGNETSMKLYGYEKYGEGWYFPIKVSQQTLNTYYGEHGEGNLRSQSFTKKTVKNAQNAVEIGDFFDVVTSHINGMSLYNTVALPMLDLERVLNYSNSSSADKVRQQIVRTFGKAAEKYIEIFHRDVNGSRKTDDKDAFIEKLSANAKKASIGMNLRVFLQQPTSIARVFLFMNPRDIPAVWNGAALKKEMQENMPIAYWKSLGFRDIGTGSTMKEVLLDNESLYDKAAMGGYGMADDFTWTLIYGAVKNEIERKNPNLDKNSAEFMEKVRERFDYIVDRSQVVDSVFHRTQIMRSGNAYTKTATMFMSEPLKTYNMYRTELLDAIKNGEVGKKTARATAVFVVSNLLLSIAQAVPDTWREDDEKELFKDGKAIPLWERFLKKIGENMVDNSNPLTYFPYIKDVWSIIQGYSQERIEYSNLSDLIANSKGLIDGKRTVVHRVLNLVKPASAVLGISAGNLIRDTKAIAETVYRMTGDEYADYVIEKFNWNVKNKDNESRFMKHYKRALQSGHSEDAATILSDYMAETFEGQDFKNKHAEKVIGEMSKLYGKTESDSKLLYDLPKQEFSFDGEEFLIPDREYPEYVSGAYGILWDMAYEMVTSEGYKKLSDEDKVRSFGEIKDYAQKAQRMEVADDYALSGWQEAVYNGEMDYIDSVLERVEEREYQASREEYKDSFEYDESEFSAAELGIMEKVESDAASYYAAIEKEREYNEKTLRHIAVYDEKLSEEMPIEEYAAVRAYAKKTAAMADGKESMKKDELKAYLDSTDYSLEVKRALFEAIGNSNWNNPY